MEAINRARFFEFLSYMRSADTVGQRAQWAARIDALTGSDCVWTAEAFLQDHPRALHWLNEHAA